MADDMHVAVAVAEDSSSLRMDSKGMDQIIATIFDDAHEDEGSSPPEVESEDKFNIGVLRAAKNVRDGLVAEVAAASTSMGMVHDDAVLLGRLVVANDGLSSKARGIHQKVVQRRNESFDMVLPNEVPTPPDNEGEYKSSADQHNFEELTHNGLAGKRASAPPILNSKVMPPAKSGESSDALRSALRSSDQGASSLTVNHSRRESSITLSDSVSAVSVTQDLQELKATTMYNMVETIDCGNFKQKIIFLTNKQANLVAESPERIKRMLDAFEIKPPKLVIQFLGSHGGQGAYRCELHNSRYFPGCVPHCAPWESNSDEAAAESKMLRFMQEVVLPLAVETNAVILCESRRSSCTLSSLFAQAVSMERSKWGDELPFTSLGISDSVVSEAYLNRAPDARWQTIRRLSNHWKQQHQILEKMISENKFGGPVTASDIDKNVFLHILVDGISGKKGEEQWDWNPVTGLLSSICKYLASDLPTVALRTGMSGKEDAMDMSYTSGLGAVVNCLSGGTPVICLDARQRPIINASDRAELIAKAREHQSSVCQALLSQDPARIDCLDFMAISYFLDIFRRGGPSGNSLGNGERGFEIIPLHKAIEQAQEPQVAQERVADFPQATRDQIRDIVVWLGDCFFPDVSKLDEALMKNFFHPLSDLQRECWIRRAEFIMAHPGCHSMHAADLDGSRQLLRRLVKLERVPKRNSLQGLYLLREAWCGYNITMNMASKYKFKSKLLFALFLCLQTLTVVTATLAIQAEGDETYRRLSDSKTWASGMAHVAFSLSLASTLLVTTFNALNPTKRWRQLRGGALAIESITWRYRARVGPFAQVPHDLCGPEKTMVRSLNEWKSELIAGSDLQLTNVDGVHNEAIFQHHQFQGILPRGNTGKMSDDFYSPVQPKLYIELRLTKKRHFYQKRIPVYSRRRFIWILMLGFITMASAACAYLNLLLVMALVSSLAASITAWTEFIDLGRKLERYSSAVRGLDMLLNWWLSLSDVEQNSTSNITALVQTSEDIIYGEQKAWQSALTVAPSQSGHQSEAANHQSSEKTANTQI